MPLNPQLGPLEVRILGMLDASDPRSVKDIQIRLEREGCPLAYTTVMTVLSRLFEKGLVSREKEGKRFAYCASARASQVKDGLLSRLGRALFQRDKVRPILTLLDSSHLNAHELKELRDLVDARVKESSKKR